MVKEEVIIGKEVNHSKYGVGKVIGFMNHYIMVHFSEGNEKKFRYPDVFEGFMELKDKRVQKSIERDLEERHNETDYVEQKKSDELYKSVKEFEKKN